MLFGCLLDIFNINFSKKKTSGILNQDFIGPDLGPNFAMLSADDASWIRVKKIDVGFSLKMAGLHNDLFRLKNHFNYFVENIKEVIKACLID